MPKKNIDKLEETGVGVGVEVGVEAVVEKSEKAKISVKKFSKNQIKRSNKFKNFADIITVSIKEDEMLTVAEVQKRVDDFLKGKVK